MNDKLPKPSEDETLLKKIEMAPTLLEPYSTHMDLSSIDGCKCPPCGCLETVTKVASTVTSGTIFTATAPI